MELSGLESECLQGMGQSLRTRCSGREMIRTKSIYDPEDEDDGLRLLVTRYWPRGVRKDRSHAWLRGLGPAPGLIKAWKSGALTWAEFRGLYLEEFGSAEKKDALHKALSLMGEHARGQGPSESMNKAVTLLCTCRDGKRCHRAILKEIIERRLRRA